jgi:hypothetical protein
LCPSAGLVVRGFGPSAAMPILRINRCIRVRLMPWPSVLDSFGQPPRAEKRPGGEQLVDPPHQRQIVVVGGAL